MAVTKCNAAGMGRRMQWWPRRAFKTSLGKDERIFRCQVPQFQCFGQPPIVLTAEHTGGSCAAIEHIVTLGRGLIASTTTKSTLLILHMRDAYLVEC